MQKPAFRSTTILAVRKDGLTALGGDGQVSLGNTVMKGGAQKVRRLANRDIATGFAGSAADAFTLFELFEKKIEEFNGNLSRASVELAREWRMDRMLRRLEAMLVVADKEEILLISGTGDVIAPDDGVLAIGSGGNYALAAARALVENSNLSARDVVEKALTIAGEICVFTNTNLIIEEIK